MLISNSRRSLPLRTIHARNVYHFIKSSIDQQMEPISFKEIPSNTLSTVQHSKNLARQLPKEDVSFLVSHYTAPALAAAYQDREQTLQCCAQLLRENQIDKLRQILIPYQNFDPHSKINYKTPLSHAFTDHHLDRIRKRLNRLPRQLTQAHSRRAAVVIPLCTYQARPCILLTVRSNNVARHKGEVCFPGGMVDASDLTIEDTCIREMREEIGSTPRSILGILRCDWSSVTSITGCAVTPLVGFMGEILSNSILLNADEVDSLFLISVEELLEAKHWIKKPNATPIFVGGPHVIWGLTAYLLDLCVNDVLQLEMTS